MSNNDDTRSVSQSVASESSTAERFAIARFSTFDDILFSFISSFRKYSILSPYYHFATLLVLAIQLVGFNVRFDKWPMGGSFRSGCISFFGYLDFSIAWKSLNFTIVAAVVIFIIVAFVLTLYILIFLVNRNENKRFSRVNKMVTRVLYVIATLFPVAFCDPFLVSYTCFGSAPSVRLLDHAENADGSFACDNLGIKVGFCVGGTICFLVIAFSCFVINLFSFQQNIYSTTIRFFGTNTGVFHAVIILLAQLLSFFTSIMPQKTLTICVISIIGLVGMSAVAIFYQPFYHWKANAVYAAVLAFPIVFYVMTILFDVILDLSPTYNLDVLKTTLPPDEYKHVRTLTYVIFFVVPFLSIPLCLLAFLLARWWGKKLYAMDYGEEMPKLPFDSKIDMSFDDTEIAEDVKVINGTNMTNDANMSGDNQQLTHMKNPSSPYVPISNNLSSIYTPNSSKGDASIFNTPAKEADNKKNDDDNNNNNNNNNNNDTNNNKDNPQEMSAPPISIAPPSMVGSSTPHILPPTMQTTLKVLPPTLTQGAGQVTSSESENNNETSFNPSDSFMTPSFSRSRATSMDSLTPLVSANKGRGSSNGGDGRGRKQQKKLKPARTLKKWDSPFFLSRATRYLSIPPLRNTPECMAMATKMFNYGTTEFPNSSSLWVDIAIYNRYYTRSIMRSVDAVKMARQFFPSIVERWVIYSIMNDADTAKNISTIQGGPGGGSSGSYFRKDSRAKDSVIGPNGVPTGKPEILYPSETKLRLVMDEGTGTESQSSMQLNFALSKATKKSEIAKALFQQLWIFLLKDHIDVPRVAKLADLAVKAAAEADDQFKKLLVTYSHSTRVLRAYGSHVRDIDRDDQIALEMFQLAQEIEDDNSMVTQQSNSVDVDNQMLDLRSNGSGSRHGSKMAGLGEGKSLSGASLGSRSIMDSISHKDGMKKRKKKKVKSYSSNSALKALTKAKKDEDLIPSFLPLMVISCLIIFSGLIANIIISFIMSTKFSTSGQVVGDLNLAIVSIFECAVRHAFITVVVTFTAFHMPTMFPEWMIPDNDTVDILERRRNDYYSLLKSLYSIMPSNIHLLMERKDITEVIIDSNFATYLADHAFTRKSSFLRILHNFGNNDLEYLRLRNKTYDIGMLNAYYNGLGNVPVQVLNQVKKVCHGIVLDTLQSGTTVIIIVAVIGSVTFLAATILTLVAFYISVVSVRKSRQAALFNFITAPRSKILKLKLRLDAATDDEEDEAGANVNEKMLQKLNQDNENKTLDVKDILKNNAVDSMQGSPLREGGNGENVDMNFNNNSSSSSNLENNQMSTIILNNNDANGLGRQLLSSASSRLLSSSSLSSLPRVTVNGTLSKSPLSKSAFINNSESASFAEGEKLNEDPSRIDNFDNDEDGIRAVNGNRTNNMLEDFGSKNELYSNANGGEGGINSFQGGGLEKSMFGYNNDLDGESTSTDLSNGDEEKTDENENKDENNENEEGNEDEEEKRERMLSQVKSDRSYIPKSFYVKTIIGMLLTVIFPAVFLVISITTVYNASHNTCEIFLSAYCTVVLENVGLVALGISEGNIMIPSGIEDLVIEDITAPLWNDMSEFSPNRTHIQVMINSSVQYFSSLQRKLREGGDPSKNDDIIVNDELIDQFKTERTMTQGSEIKKLLTQSTECIDSSDYIYCNKSIVNRLYGINGSYSGLDGLISSFTYACAALTSVKYENPLLRNFTTNLTDPHVQTINTLLLYDLLSGMKDYTEILRNTQLSSIDESRILLIVFFILSFISLFIAYSLLYIPAGNSLIEVTANTRLLIELDPRNDAAMSMLEWDTSYGSDVVRLDSTHEKICDVTLKLVNVLEKTELMKKDPDHPDQHVSMDEVIKISGEFLVALFASFADEEKMMSHYNIAKSHCNAHTKEHVTFCRKACEVILQILSGNTNERPIMEATAIYLQNHVSKVDKELGMLLLGKAPMSELEKTISLGKHKGEVVAPESFLKFLASDDASLQDNQMWELLLSKI